MYFFSEKTKKIFYFLNCTYCDIELLSAEYRFTRFGRLTIVWETIRLSHKRFVRVKLDLPKIPDDISLLREDLAASILGTTSRVLATHDGYIGQTMIVTECQYLSSYNLSFRLFRTFHLVSRTLITLSYHF